MIAIYLRVVNHRKLVFFSPLALKKNYVKATQYKLSSFPSQLPTPSCGFFSLTVYLSISSSDKWRSLPAMEWFFAGDAESVFYVRVRVCNGANLPDLGWQKFKNFDSSENLCTLSSLAEESEWWSRLQPQEVWDIVNTFWQFLTVPVVAA